MSFTIGKLLPYHYDKDKNELNRAGYRPEARKKFKRNRKVKMNHFAVFSMDTPIGQPFHSYEHLNQNFADSLKALDEHEAPLVLFRGSNIQTRHSITHNQVYSRAAKVDVLDDLSSFFIFDIDYCSCSEDLSVNTGVLERYRIALDERLSFLKGKRVVVMLSSSAGVEYVYKNDEKVDYNKRLSLRVFVEFDTKYTIETLRDELLNYLSSGRNADGAHVEEVCDTRYLKSHSQQTYIQSADLIDTKYHINGEKVVFIEGDALSINEVKEACEWREPIKSNFNAINLDINVNATLNNAKIIKHLESKPWKDSGKWDYFNSFFSELCFYRPDTVIPVLEDIATSKILVTSSYPLEKFKDQAGFYYNKMFDQIRCVDKEMRKYYGEIIQLDSLDLSKAVDFADGSSLTPSDFFVDYVKDAKYLGFQSDCGTAKSKGVIQKTIEHCKKSGKSVLYIANTKAIVVKQCEEFHINSYVKNGEKVHQKESVIRSSRILGMCYMSLHYFKGLDLADWEYDYIIIDEASQVLRGWSDAPDKASEEISYLFSLCDRASHVHLYDADYDDELCTDFFRRLRDYKAKEASLFINNAKRAEGYEVELAESKSALLFDILKTLEEGKRICVFASENNDTQKLNALCDYIDNNLDWDLSYLAFDKTETEEKERLVKETREYLSSKLREGLQMLVLSPWSGIGFDYFHPQEHFDKTYILDDYGFITAKRKWQFLRRMRTCRKGMVFSSYRGGQLPVKAKFKKLLHKHKGIQESDLERLDAWYVQARHCIDMDAAHGKWHFKEQLRYRGAEIKPHRVDKELIKQRMTAFNSHVRAYQIRQGVVEDSEAEKVLSVMGNFRKPLIGRGGVTDWVDLTLDDAIDNSKYLCKENSLMSKENARKISLYMAMSETERMEYDKNDVFAFSCITGLVLDAFLKMVGSGEIYNLKSFLSWFLFDERGEITLTMEWIDNGRKQEFADLLREYRYVLPETLKLKQDAYKEPLRAIGVVAGFFGMEYSSITLANKDKVKKRNALFAYYKENKVKGYDPRGSLSDRTDFAIREITRKGNKITKLEKEYLLSTKDPYTLKRKRYIHTEVWRVYFNKLKALEGKNNSAPSEFQIFQRSFLASPSEICEEGIYDL